MARSIETYILALAYLGKRGALLGMNILSTGFQRINFMSLIVILDAVTYSMITIYCVVEFIHDLEKVVFCLVTYGFGIQVRSKSKQSILLINYSGLCKNTNLLDRIQEHQAS